MNTSSGLGSRDSILGLSIERVNFTDFDHESVRDQW